MKFPLFKNRYVAITFVFILWRSFLFLVASIAPYFIENFADKFPYKSILAGFNLPYYIWTFANFDGVHYLRIAQDGYEQKFTQVFFPLYPILIRVFSYLTFGNMLIAALAVANIAFLGALMIFYRMISQIYNQKTAIWSVIFLLAFPTSFYFGSAYSESLFFFLIVSYFYLIYRKRIVWASLLGAFASATRLIGIFLVVTLKPKLRISYILPMAFIPIGILSYIVYLTLMFKQPFYFISAQQVFGQERSTQGIVLLPQVFWRYFKILTTTEGAPFLNASFELISAIFALVMLVLAYKKVKSVWLIFSVAAVILPTLSGTLVSMPRYILVAFPIFVVLAKINSAIIKITIFSVFFILLIILTSLFTRGYWIA